MKPTIRRVGGFDAEGRPTGWVVDGTDADEWWTVEELRAIAAEREQGRSFEPLFGGRPLEPEWR